MQVLLCLPTLNAALDQASFIGGLKRQSVSPDKFLVIDSDSTDGCTSFFEKSGATVHVIPRSSFNHGGTRQLALELFPTADIFIFMTQDAILASPDSLKNIIGCFEDEEVGAVCGRQLPHLDASPIAAHARWFNYPDKSYSNTKADLGRVGIKAAFISNSFAAYRRSVLLSVGGFPKNVIFGEDTYVAAKMLLRGWKVAYCADASVFHSHNYTFRREFQRYFDIGVFHSRDPWFLEALGKAEGEGKKFVQSEMRYLAKSAPWFIPSALLRTGLKLLGYKLGRRERFVPLWLKYRLSMLKGYWQEA